MINLVVEGDSDREAARAVVQNAGKSEGRIIVAGGKSKLDPKIPKYNEAAKYGPWVVFRDSDSKCPVELKQELTSNIQTFSTNFSLRIAHSMTEAWLLADRAGFAAYFHVSQDLIVRNPEDLSHGKSEVLRLCARSRLRKIRESMVSSHGETGPLYVSTINDFAATKWDVDAAKENSDSLNRALEEIRSLP